MGEIVLLVAVAAGDEPCALLACDPFSRGVLIIFSVDTVVLSSVPVIYSNTPFIKKSD